jgi:hypothetical protein
MRDWFDELEPTLRDYIPNVVAAIIILIVGWLVATVVSAIVRGVLGRLRVDDRLGRQMDADGESRLPVSEWIAKAVFWLIILVTAAAFFRTLNIPAISNPLDRALDLIFSFIPRLVGAIALLLLAWVLARVARGITVRVLNAARVDERVSNQLQPAEAAGTTAGTGAMPPPVRPPADPAAPQALTGEPADRPGVSLAQTLGDVVFWLVILFFIPGVLSVLNMPGLLAPVQAVVDRVLTIIPNLVAAGLIVLIGWFVARILQRIVAGLLSAAGVDRLAERVGIQRYMGNQTISGLLGLVVYVLILVPAVIAALDALQITAISEPATEMLEAVLAMIPRLFAAAVILVVAYFIARLVANLVSSLLAGFGFDTIPQRLGFTRQPAENEPTPSQLVGYVVLVAIMLFASIEAAEALHFALVADIILEFTIFAGHVLLGVIMLAIGIYLANLVYGIVSETGVQNAALLATVARVAILVLATAMALRQMGIADDIINLAFALILGAGAVAAAIAFGLGGRERAGQELDQFIDGLRRGPALPGRGAAQGALPPPAATPPQAEQPGP